MNISTFIELARKSKKNFNKQLHNENVNAAEQLHWNLEGYKRSVKRLALKHTQISKAIKIP